MQCFIAGSRFPLPRFPSKIAPRVSAVEEEQPATGPSKYELPNGLSLLCPITLIRLFGTWILRAEAAGEFLGRMDLRHKR